MKLLHIGKKGNINRFSKKSELMEGIEIIEMPSGLGADEYLAIGKDAEFIIADAMAKVSEELIKGMPNLKMIHSEGVGYNFFDLEAAREKQIYVCNCKGMNAMAVAEQTILLMLSMLRNVRNCDQAVRNGHQIEKKEEYMKKGNLKELSDCKVGVIGFGDIAKCTAMILKSFNVETYYYSRTQSDKDVEEKYNVKYLELDELLKNCNVFSIHLPVTNTTYEMVNDEFLSKIPEGSYLVNTSRGELVDSLALVRALESGKLEMAALDTIAGEPVQLSNVLLNQEQKIMEKIIFSPHIGGITASSFKRGYSMIWSNIKKVIAGEKPDRIVNSL
ncbi:NAD(P)-dependent oxidoreductase [Clostridium sp. BL-8]|uniref:NAD(P)-dependent oxidoreductase n=1 Tax=Clostridium sp. BL-8 TaxID=349938 RepID=UPI00098C9137|nr:NAD(P)-dependent oxidoreductase [Clostridium sp. BL-8]OOM75700.1 hydroxypyruvate reductase [Clostridium sp. BL-8]